MIQSGLMTGFSLILGMVCMACALRDMVRQRKEVLQEEWEELPTYFITSSGTGLGREAFLDYIDTVNKSILG